MRFKPLIFLMLTASVLAGLFFAMRPPDPVQPKSATADSETPTAHLFDIAIADGKRIAGPALISVNRGAKIILQFTTNQAGELHLHGYDLSLQLTPEEPVRLQFTAEHAGRFEYELHGHGAGHRALGVIEVLP